jgi:hypothetical protein
MKEREEARLRAARLEGELEALRRVPLPKRDEPPPYEDVTQMEDEEIKRRFDEDPKGFLANFYAQTKHELSRELEQYDNSKIINQGIKKTFDEYASKHPDYMPMWNSGELKRFMDANPGHNAISAHQILTAEKKLKDLQDIIAKETEKVKKETEDRVTKNFMAKKTATVLGTGPAVHTKEEIDKELQDTKNQGGLVSVIAKRLQRMREGSA